MKTKLFIFGAFFLMLNFSGYSQKHYVGEEYGDGIVFFTNGEQGLIVSKKDIGKPSTWEDAVKNCQMYLNEGESADFSPWHLPSLGELIVLSQSKVASTANFEGVYWSSEDIMEYMAFSYHISKSGLSAGGKNVKYKVRAIRYFTKTYEGED